MSLDMPQHRMPSPQDKERVMRDRYERGAQRTRKLTACPAETREGKHGHCYADSYGRRQLQDAYLADCPPGTTEGPAGTCWRTPHIFGRVRMAGWNGDCYPDEDKRCEGVCGASFVTCLKKCPPGYANDGLTCRKTDVGLKMGKQGRWTCPDKEAERINRKCWEPCRAGYVGRGKTCVPQSGPGIKKTVQDRMKCEDDHELIGQLCYPKCRDGYKAAAGKMCIRDCPDGFEPDPYRPTELCVRSSKKAAPPPAPPKKMSVESARRLLVQREAEAKAAAEAVKAAVLKGESASKVAAAAIKAASPSKAAAAAAAAAANAAAQKDKKVSFLASARRLLSLRRRRDRRRYDDFEDDDDDYYSSRSYPSPSPFYTPAYRRRR
jgi:hypothetical protein